MSSSLNPPDVELRGTAVDSFMSSLATGKDRRIADHRPTLRDIAEDIGAMRELEKASSILPSAGGTVWARKLLHLLEDFVSLHRAPASPMDEFELRGAEREQTTMIQRMKRYMTYRLLLSKKTKVDGTPWTDSRGRPVYMALSSLRNIKALAVHAIAYLCYPKLSLQEREAAKEALESHLETLRIAYSLSTPVKSKLVLRAPDIRGLVSHLYNKYADRPELAVMMHVVIVSFFMLGARGGSLLATAHHPTSYLRLKHITFIPERDTVGRITAFTAKVTLASFKGYMSGNVLSIIFTLCSPKQVINLGLDLAIPLLASFLHRKVLPFETVEDLLATDLIEFKCLSEHDELPVFLARKSRTALGDLPLSLNTANTWFKSVLTSYGIDTSQRFGCSLYACRRGFATELKRNYGEVYAKHFLGHKPNSSLLYTVYDRSADTIDVTGGVIGDGDAKQIVGDLPSHTRVPIADNALSVSEACRHDPTYIETFGLLQRLKVALRFGSTAWLTQEPFCKASPPLKQEDLPLIVVNLQASLKRLARILASQKEDDAAAKANQVRRAMVWKEVQRRKAEGEDAAAVLRPLVQEIESDNLQLFAQAQAGEGTDEAEAVAAQFDVDQALPNVSFDDNEHFDDDEFDVSDDEDEDTASDEATQAGAGGWVAEVDDSMTGEATGADSGTSNDEADDDAAAPPPTTGDVAADHSACTRYLESHEAAAASAAQAGAGTPGHDLQHLLPDGPATPITLLYRLVDLLDNGSSEPCTLCQEDPYCTQEDKEKRYRKTQIQQKRKHELTHHSIYARAMRFLLSCVTGSTCQWSVQSNQQNKQRLHLERFHSGELPADYAAGLKDSTAAATREQHRQDLQNAKVGGYSSVGKQGHRSTEPAFDLLRFTDAQMLEEEVGLANSIIASGPIDFGTDLIPTGFIAADGSLLMDSSDDEDDAPQA